MCTVFAIICFRDRECATQVLLNLCNILPVRVHATVYAPPFFESRRESTPPTPPQFIKLFCYKLVDVMLH